MPARRLLAVSRGGSGFSVPPFAVSGPYSPAVDHSSRLMTQVHCHTTGSDGSQSPAAVVANYVSKGYDVLAITDHDVVTTQPAGITTAITANELSPAGQHIISLNSDYTRGVTTDAQQIIDGIVGDGGLAEIAHPNWSIGMTTAEMLALTDYAGIEIHNGTVVPGAGGADPSANSGFALDAWDTMLATRKDVWGFAVDDYHLADAFRTYDVGRLHVFAASPTVADVMAAIAAGNFMADVSNYGVTPGYPVRGNLGVSWSCPGATGMEAWGSSGLLVAATGSSIAYGFNGTEDYVRLVAIGEYEDEFTSLSDRWEEVDGTWTVSGGSLNVSSDATARRIVLRQHRAEDFEAEADVEISNGGTDAIALMFNVLDSDHWYFLRIGESGVSGYDNELAVAVTTNNSLAADSQLDNATFDPAPGTVYTLKMAYTAATGRIRGKVWETGGIEPDWMVDVTDTTWKHGMFAIRANRSCKVHRLYINGFRTYSQPIAID